MSSQTAAFDLSMLCHSLCTKVFHVRFGRVYHLTTKGGECHDKEHEGKTHSEALFPQTRLSVSLFLLYYNHSWTVTQLEAVLLARSILQGPSCLKCRWTQVELLFTVSSRQSPVDLILIPPVGIKAKIYLV